MTPTTSTLLRQGHRLADPREQIRVLESESGQPPFARTLLAHDQGVLAARGIDILQVNVGKVCNQTCSHCHVDAGPDRREAMSQETFQACLDAVRTGNIGTVDITGGAPEMNPHFRWFVQEARQLGAHVIDRCNLTILLANGFTDLPEFLAEHEVEIVASLPCYTVENTDRQRGEGVFNKSIFALRRLNDLGYGRPGSGLDLSLVYNPGGPSLPPPQAALEEDYRRELREHFDVEFTRLYTITNQPISRFLDDLLQQGRFEEYMQKLVDGFNPGAVDGVMCRNTLSVDWEGNLFDCDFNQMLELEVAPGQPRTIRDFDASLGSRAIVTGQHCYACTAGAGSSCQGAIA